MIIYFTGTGNSRYAAQVLAQVTGDDMLDAAVLIREKNYPTVISTSPVFAKDVFLYP